MEKEKSLKILKCKYCHRIVENVGNNAISVVCGECTQESLNNALEDQEKEILKGGIGIMEENKVGKKQLYKEMEPKIIELSKAGKSPSEIKKELGANSPGIPKIKRVINSVK